VWLTIGPGTPLIDEVAAPEARDNPLYHSLAAGFRCCFLLLGPGVVTTVLWAILGLPLGQPLP
jgi:hypothetical protein